MMIINSNRFAAAGASYTVDYLVVAGGGGGGTSTAYGGGHGGAGGLLQGNMGFDPGVTYTITVGLGGGVSVNGQNSSVDGVIVAIGGGRGGNGGSGGGYPGGSGGGGFGGGGFGGTNAGGAGTPGQGNMGGTGNSSSAGAGGGAGGAAAGSTSGDGINSSITGTSVLYARGGPRAVAANTGHGGWGASPGFANAEPGSSGVVILAYPGVQRGTGGTVTSSGGNTIHRFTSSGTYTA